ncbi:unnamed protein product [Diatraea saccharalis]|uniref:Mitochondrial ribosomal protein L55 n=1 Tax=Diatraea saccharalis TaxID=40085 RepID=A0A9N9QX66_9NEOP|nr:unnamed protein product [Diatraea saccharalis]
MSCINSIQFYGRIIMEIQTKLLRVQYLFLNSYLKRYLNNNIADITKIHRDIYTRRYPTKVVKADGSSIDVRYHEPRKIIKLPLDLSLLSEDERRIRLEKRKPKKKVKISDDLEDNFNAKKYLKYLKK